MPYRKSKNNKKTKTTEQKMKSIAQNVMNSTVETKEAIYDRVERKPYAPIITGDVANYPIVAQQPNGVNSNYFDLLPGISQSVSGESGRKYNTRIGNEIILKSIHMKGFLEYDQSFATDTDAKNKKLLVRVMVLSAKRSGNFTTAYTNISNRMLRNSTDANENTGPFTGAAINGIQDINRDVFTVHYEKKIYMNAPVLLQGASNPDVGVNPSSLKFIDKKLYFGGKSGMRLKFANAGATVPENFAPFICIGYSSLSANQVPSNGLVAFTYNAVAEYKDA